MNGIRTEMMHNTPEQVREYVREALSVLEDCAVPAELWTVAFPNVLSMVAAKQIAIEQVQPMSPLMAIPKGV